MPSTHPSLTRVTAAERSGGGRPSQDRIFLTDNAVVVLDGASHPDPQTLDGRWIADQLGDELRSRLAAEPQIDLQTVLGDAIAALASRHDLRPGASPSTTVNMVRWGEGRVDVLVLCDSPVVVVDHQGKPHEVRDDRLGEVNDEIGRPAGFQTEDPVAWRAFIALQRQHRNVATGFWVAEAEPEAAEHAVVSSWPHAEVAGVLAMTDGVSKGVDKYGVPVSWTEAYKLATDDPALLVDAVQKAEESDPDGTRWPRSKRHDDKALAVIQFSANGAAGYPMSGGPSLQAAPPPPATDLVP